MAVPAERAAEAPLDGAVKLITPPSTGSIGLLAVTVSSSGWPNAVLIRADCGVLPATGVRMNPWLWKAPMSGLGASSGKLRWSVVRPMAAPWPMAGLPGSRAMVWVGPP